VRRDSEVGALVLVQTPAGWAAFTPGELDEAVERARTVLPPERAATGATNAPARLLTAEELSAATSIPASWFEQAAREGSIPCIRLGRYVRFALDEIVKSPRFRERDR